MYDITARAKEEEKRSSILGDALQILLLASGLTNQKLLFIHVIRLFFEIQKLKSPQHP
jgi:hypothetical protein